MSYELRIRPRAIAEAQAIVAYESSGAGHGPSSS